MILFRGHSDGCDRLPSTAFGASVRERPSMEQLEDVQFLIAVRCFYVTLQLSDPFVFEPTVWTN